MWVCGFRRFGTQQWVVVFTPYAGMYRVFVSWFLSYPMPLGIREFSHCWGRDFRDHGGSWDIRMVLL